MASPGACNERDSEVGHITYYTVWPFSFMPMLGDFYNRGSLPVCRRGCVLEECQPDVPLHVFRNVDGAGVLGQGTGDGLADPPGHMGGDAEASAHINFSIARVSPIAVLDHIQEQKPKSWWPYMVFAMVTT